MHKIKASKQLHSGISGYRKTPVQLILVKAVMYEKLTGTPAEEIFCLMFWVKNLQAYHTTKYQRKWLKS